MRYILFQIQLKSFIKIFIFCIIAVIIGVLYYNADIIIEVTDIDFALPFISDYKESYVQFHRQLSAMLLEAEEYVEKENYLKALLKIRTVVALLDRRYHESVLPSSIYKFKKKAINMVYNTTSSPEKEISFSINLFESEIIQPKINLSYATIPPSVNDLSPFVTIFIDGCENESGLKKEEIYFKLISQIRKQFSSVEVILATNSTNVKADKQIRRLKYVRFKEVVCDNWNRVPMESVLPFISTPHMLVLSSVAAITSDLNINRLLSVASGVKGVGVVGFSERGSDGGWDYTCFQLKNDNHKLSIIDGYEYSKEVCLFCDVTSQSFLASTNLLRKVLPDSNLPLGPRQIDWALRLQKLNIITLTCPDVMIHTNKKIMNDRKSDTEVLCQPQHLNEHVELKHLYAKLAIKCKLLSISFDNGTIVDYRCSEINYNCGIEMTKTLHPCCYKEKEEVIKRFNTFSKFFLIPYKIEKKHLLGVVNLKDVSPQDRKITLDYQNSEEIFKEYKDNLFENTFYEMIQYEEEKVNNSNYNFRIRENGFQLDLLRINKSSDYITINSSTKLPRNFPCLLFGHYAISIHDFLNNSSHRKANLIKEWKNKVNRKRDTQNILNGAEDLIMKTLEEEKCFLYSFVKVGNVWVPGPLNPGKHSLKMLDDNFRKNGG